MARSDISNYLIHFTSDETIELAYRRLKKIISDRRLIPTGSKIRGHYKCVCFSEAPLPSLIDGLVNPFAYSRYSPFGLMFHKTHIFQKGGRPVIYEPDEEYTVLPDDARWRHMIYEPLTDPPIDFTWEREWRIRCETLEFGPHNVVIVMPDSKSANRLRSEHEREEDYKVMQYSVIMEQELAEVYYEPFPWRVVALRT
jgi:hypothetical protein